MTRVLKRHMRWIMNLWPPFLGAGIRVKRLQPDWKAIDVEMKFRFWNANYAWFDKWLMAVPHPEYDVHPAQEAAKP